MADITTINGLPKFISKPRVISESIIETARMNNQFLLGGANPELLGDHVIAFIETIVNNGAAAQLQDANGNNVGIPVTGVAQFYSAIRLDGGFKVVGTVNMIKGFYLGA